MNRNIRRTNTRKDQAEEMRLHILNTALTVFASKGYSKSSIKDLAKVAGISQGLMYHYFVGKEDLLMAAIEYHSFLPQLRQILSDNSRKPFREVMQEIAVKFLALIDSKSELLNILIQESQTNSEIKKAWGKILEEGTSLLQQFIRSRIASGEIREHNVRATAYSMFSTLVMFHFTRSVFNAPQIPETDFINTVLDNLIQGIKAGR